MKKAISLTAIFLLLLSVPQGGIKSQSNDTAQVSLNYSNTQSAFSDYLFGNVTSPVYDQNGFVLSKDCGFRLLETGNGMPIPLNANDSTQYNFTALDQSVAEIINQGMEPLLWLGMPSKKPANLTNYATFIKNVIRHYKQGWDKGYYYKLKVVRWANEPDLTNRNGTGVFWTGTQQEFFDTYAAVSNAIKLLDGTIIIDAPGFAFPTSWSGNTRVLDSWVTNFLSYCQTNNVKVDIFSFHAYTPTAYYQFYYDMTLMNNALSVYPTLSNIYGTPKLGNDEWNTMVGDLWSGSYHKQFDSAWVAAHNILALSAMTSQGLKLSIRYGGTFNSVSNCHDFLITDCNSNGKPSYFAFKGFNMLAGHSILQTTGSDYINFSATSGKSTDTVTLVLSNFDALTYLNRFEPNTSMPPWTDYNKYVANFGTPAVYEYARIAVNNLPWTNNNIKVFHYLVDDNNDLNIIDTFKLKGNSNLYFTVPMAAPSVHIFKIFKETITGIEIYGKIPERYRLYENYPNPFNPSTTIRFSLPQRSHVMLKVFDVLGREISILVNDEVDAGEHSVQFNAKQLPSGVYFYQLRAAGFIQTNKMLVAK